MPDKTYCGYVAIIGRPNVGKSTLLNALIGQKISITSRKPQTTRHRILGINTQNNAQIIYIDTPGLHQKTPHALNRYMNRTANTTIFDGNLIVFMVDALRWQEDDEWILKKIKKADVPIILAVNKVDKVADKKLLLPFLETLNQKLNFLDIIPLSAKNKINVDALEHIIIQHLPEGAHYFEDDQITDRTERFLAAEMIREKLFRHLGQELPYALTVLIEQFKLDNNLLRISAVIYVEKTGQKSIVIGEGGRVLKEVGQEARLDMQKLFEHKVFLQLWVKVKNGWSDNERSLHSLGYD